MTTTAETTVTVSARLPVDQAEQLKAYAERTETSVSRLVRSRLTGLLILAEPRTHDLDR